jgi:hypothetical protein
MTGTWEISVFVGRILALLGSDVDEGGIVAEAKKISG